jgi:hypothetical protein
VIFAEYAIDTAVACHAQGIATVAVTAGYIHPEARRDFYAVMDAANVDLKAFTDDFYVHQCGAHLAPVLDTLAWLHHETDVWVEITTLLIPGLNDSDAELTALAKWVATEMGPDVPLHFTAFHPDYKLDQLPPTPPATLAAPAASPAMPACTTFTPATCTTRRAAPPTARAAGSGHRARLVRHPRLPARRPRRLPGLRPRDCRPLWRIPRRIRPAPCPSACAQSRFCHRRRPTATPVRP